MNDPFRLLGVAPRFDLDLALLDEHHKRESLVAHPDRLRQSSVAERRQALSLAMTINEAHRALRAPVTRALALLDVRGPGRAALPHQPLDFNFLETMMERREALSEARTVGDMTRISALLSETEADRIATLQQVAFAFRGNGPLEPGPLAELDRALSTLRYYDRFIEDAEGIED